MIHSESASASCTINREKIQQHLLIPKWGRERPHLSPFGVFTPIGDMGTGTFTVSFSCGLSPFQSTLLSKKAKKSKWGQATGVSKQANWLLSPFQRPHFIYSCTKLAIFVALPRSKGEGS